MRKSLMIAICSLFFTSNTIAQNDGNASEHTPYIEVNGSAEKRVMPDEIYISITIKERESGRDQVSIEQQETQLKAALASINIPLENLTISDANADYIRVKFNKKNVISQSEYQLKVATAQQVSDAFEKLDELKIDNAYISHTDHSNIIALRKEVRIMAITAAKEKADYLLEAIGQNTGKALIVKETINPIMRGYELNTLQAVSINYEEKEAIKSEITFSKIKLESNIYVKFEID